MKQASENLQNHNCKNCGQSIFASAKYCSNCGQKNTDGRISIKSFFNSFFSTVFNLESKFFQTMGHIFIPGKLTAEYFKGKHKRYFHPVRLFIVSALILIAAVGSQLSDMSMHNVHEQTENYVRKESFLLTMKEMTKKTLEKFPGNSSLRPAFDSLYQDLKEQELIGRDSVDMNKAIVTDGLDNINIKISNEDFLNYTPDELADKYNIEGYRDRFLFKQKVKLLKEEGSFVPFVLGNSLWIVLLMMPFLALILKLLYIRKDYYYVEHLVFSFHTHAFAFLLLALVNFLAKFYQHTLIAGLAILVLFLYLYMAIYRVYGQSKFITLIKLLLINISYLFLFFFFFIFGLLASMAIF